MPAKRKKQIPAPRARQRRARRPRVEDPLAPHCWDGEGPPFCLQILRLRGQPRRLLVDLETNPALTPYENDQLVEVVLDYLHRIGRDSGIFTGYERSDDERRKDIGDFLVVRRGETWEQRRSEIPVIDETPLGLPRARRP